LGLKHFRIPSNVVEIGASAFACCRQLMSVHLLSNSRTTRIEEETFRACDSWKHARIPWSVTRIERAAFATRCIRKLDSVDVWELAEGLETIHVAHLSSSLFLYF
jgi:hypothetical protein